MGFPVFPASAAGPATAPVVARDYPGDATTTMSKYTHGDQTDRTIRGTGH